VLLGNRGLPGGAGVRTAQARKCVAYLWCGGVRKENGGGGEDHPSTVKIEKKKKNKKKKKVAVSMCSQGDKARGEVTSL